MLLAGASDNNIDVNEFAFHNHNHEEVLLNTLKSPCNIPATWILLDNQSTIDVFSNEKLLRNLSMTKNTMRIHSTGGVSYTDMVGDLHGTGTVQYGTNLMELLIFHHWRTYVSKPMVLRTLVRMPTNLL
jgi:hypothetical protein